MDDEVELFVPMGSNHLDIQLQKSMGGISNLTVWYICNPEEQLKQTLVFRIVGTGWELPDDFIQKHFWLKTIQHDGYVWHIFLKQVVN